jgi:hypothetical protein
MCVCACVCVCFRQRRNIVKNTKNVSVLECWDEYAYVASHRSHPWTQNSIVTGSLVNV